MLLTFKLGLLLGLSIIISIGPQNLFVIKQGLRQEKVYLCAFTCFFADVIMILFGVMSISTLLNEVPFLKIIMLALEIIFLAFYGGAACRRAFIKSDIVIKLNQLTMSAEISSSSLKLSLLALSFSLLNPQAIMDTAIIIGGSANHYVEQEKCIFVLGTITTSIIWFFGLAFSSKLLANNLMNIKFWQILEGLSGIIMITFALKLAWQLLQFIP